MNFSRYSNSNFGIFDSNKKNKNEFGHSNSNPFQRIDNMDVDIPSQNNNSFTNQYNSNNSNFHILILIILFKKKIFLQNFKILLLIQIIILYLAWKKN